MQKYIIGTGWWCDGTHRNPTPHIKSSDKLHSEEFFELWYHFVNRYTDPEKIIIVDSDSPVKPNLPIDKRIELIRLRENFGHSITLHEKATMSGWKRALLVGAIYSFANDCDFIFIEQDCLVKGTGWVEKCMEKLKNKKIMYGCGAGTPQPLQQCLAIVKKEFIPIFIAKLIKQQEVSIEAMRRGKSYEKYCDEWQWYRAFRKDVYFIPFGYGRVRPIYFDDLIFYAQHWTDEELKKLIEQTDKSFLSRLGFNNV